MASSSNPKSPDIKMTHHNNASVTSVAAPVADRNKDDLKVEYFHGDTAKLGMFLVQLKAVFTLQKAKYNTHAERVMFAGLHMRGSAFSWFEPIMTDQLTSYPD